MPPLMISPRITNYYANQWACISFIIIIGLVEACSGDHSKSPSIEATMINAASQEISKNETPVYKVTVSAGDIDRSQTIVSFHLPDAIQPGHYEMTEIKKQVLPLQVDKQQIGWFLLDSLPAGSSVTYELDPSATISQSNPDLLREVTPVRDHNTIRFLVNNQPVLRYYHDENQPPPELDDRYRRGGYIHPVYSPGGTILTNHLNPEAHPHHSGIWSAWTHTRFGDNTPDFWNVHQNTGRVDIDTMTTYWSGNTHGGFQSRHRFTDLTGEQAETALNEHWVVRVYQSPEKAEFRIFDLNITQTANSDRPLLLPEYRYGGVGFRGHVDWDDPENCFFLTSDGLSRDGHATRARWAHIGGYTDGKLAGIAVLGHPSNYRFPQTMRIHPDEPFFNFAPTQLGDMRIAPGEPYVARYRYVTYDGNPDPELIDRLWFDYAYPPGVTVKKLD